jgi:hypothetical protein
MRVRKWSFRARNRWHVLWRAGRAWRGVYARMRRRSSGARVVSVRGLRGEGVRGGLFWRGGWFMMIALCWC